MIRTITRRRRLPLVPAALVLVSALLCAGPVSTAWACPLCSESAEDVSRQTSQGEEGTDVAAGFAVSILFMMSLPYVIVGTFGYAIYRAHKSREATDAVEALPPVE